MTAQTREQRLHNLADRLRAELKYVHATGDIRDSVRDCDGGALWADCDELLGEFGGDSWNDANP